MTASRPTPSASWSSGTTRLRGKHSTLRIHSWLPHGALNGSNGWTHSLEAREFANDTAICGVQHNWREQRLAPEIVGTAPTCESRDILGAAHRTIRESPHRRRGCAGAKASPAPSLESVSLSTLPK